MSFGVIISNHSIKIKPIYVIRIHIVNVKTDDAYKDVADNVEKSFDPSNYETEGRNQKVIRLMKD